MSPSQAATNGVTTEGAGMTVQLHTGRQWPTVSRDINPLICRTNLPAGACAWH
jgi:hypothetical protein